jgi:hypothetical protein
MYCPQCGRELELDSGEIRFCRYCGFSLTETKEALHGYSQQKRMGFSIVTWAYALLLLVTLLLHGQYVSLDSRWGYWIPTLFIVVSVSFFVSAAVSALKPALFSKSKRGNHAKLEDTADTRELSRTGQAASLPAPGVPVSELANQARRRETAGEPRSVVEGTTKKLDERSQ